MEKTICQSCGMPMSREEDFGKNADGSKNNEYCHFCFADGKFTMPDLTLIEQTNRLVKLGTAKLGLSAMQAREIAKNTLPKLKRWKA